jgi:hypothetical protein
MMSFDELTKVHATLRFLGDKLDTADISARLSVAPKPRCRRTGSATDQYG